MANDTQAVSYDFESINPDFSLGAGASAADSPFAPLIQSAGSVTVSAPQESDEGRTIAGTAGDVAITALKGAIGLPEAAVGLLDIALGGRAGKTLEDLGYRPDDAKKILDGLYSEYQKRANRSVQEAEGFLGTVAAMLDNPSTIFHTALESSPQMLGGAAIARGILAGAPKIAPWVAGAMGEGAMGAGSAASQIRQESEDGLISGKQSWSALGSGADTFALGAAGGKLAQKVGLTDVDTLLASGMKGAGKTARAGFIRQVLGSGISEGVLEELPQSMQEQMWQNYATGKPIMEGVDKAGAQGMMAGLALGGAGGGFNAAMSSLLGPQQDESAPTDPVADAAQQPNSPLSRAAVASRPKDDISTRVGEIEQLVRDGDLLQRLREIGNPSANTAGEFLEALAVARNPGAAPAARQQALDSLEETLGWIEAGAMPFDEATGSPFRTDLTVRPDDGPGDGPAGGAPVLPGPLALPDPNVIDVDATVVGEQAQEADQAPAEEPAADIPTPPAQEAAAQPVEPLADVDAPRVRTPAGQGTAVSRRRAEQLRVLAADGFTTVERDGDNFYLVNHAKRQRVRLDNALEAQRARHAVKQYVDEQARTAAAAPDGDLADPTPAQIEAGNYKKSDVINVGGMRVRLENPAGSTRSGVDADGNAWSTTMQHHYGEIQGIEGADGDKLDAFIGPRPDSGRVFVIDQVNPDGSFGEHKVMVGFTSPEAARAGYLANYDAGWQGLGAMTEMTVPQFREWARSPASKLPANGYDLGDTQEAGNVRDIGTVEQAAGDRQARAGGEGAGVDARRSVRDGEAAVDDRTNQAAEEARRDRELVEELAREIGDPSLRVAPRSPEADALRALLRAAKRVFGVHAIAVDTKSDRFDGVTHRGVVMVNVRDPQMHVAQTIGHELAHTQEESAAKLRERLWSLVSEDGRRAYYEGYLRRDEGWSYDRASDLELAKLKSEMLADFMGNRFNDRAWLESLARQRPALFGNFVRDWLRMLDSLIGTLRGMARAMDPRAAKQVDKYITDLSQARQIAADIATEWAERHKGLARRTGVAASLRETQFSRREETKRAYEQRIDELFAGGRPRLSGVRVLDRSDMVGLLGIGDGPVNLAEGKVVASESNHPRMTAEVWKKIPDWLDNPAMVFDSDTEPGRLVLVGPELVGGSPVRIILEPNASGAVSAHLLVNAYDAKASPFRRWERDGLLRYVDRNKFARVSGTFQPRLTGLPGDRRRGPILTDKHLAGWRKANPTQYSLRDSIEVTESDWADFQAELAAADTYASEFTAGAVTAADIQAEGLFAEEAFGDLRWSSDGERSVIRLPERDGAADTLVIEQKDSGKFELKGMPGTYVTAAQASTVRDYAARQVAARRLFDRGFDLLSTTAEDARQGLVDAWRNVSSRDQVEGTGAKRLGDVADASRSMKSILRDLGMPGNWSASVFSDRMPDGVVLIVEFQNADTAEVQPGVIDITERDGRLVATASTSQMRSGGMGTIFYQAASAYLARKGIPLAPDYGLSGINAYRRTEQMISAALRTGKSNAMLPHDAQRVYGFNERARSRSEHDENLGRLLLAGLRNAREIAPEIVGLTYHPETDSFTDRAGADAASLVDGILQRDASRTFGLGRGTMARAALTQQALAGESIDADRFSSPVLYSARDQAAAEYAAVEAKHRGTDGWMKAPNGNPTNLNEGQWIQVRTPSFKAWFGDWERFAGTRDGVWGDSKGEVSKVVDGNGEPLVLYHGTDKGGFMSFKEPGGTGRGDLGIFATDDRSMARSYVRRNRVDDIVPPSSRDDLEDAGYQFEEDEDGVTLIDPDGYNSTFDTEQEAVDYALENFSAIGEMPGIYAVFANIRDPNEAYFEGANWDGSRNGQWTVWADDEQQSDPSGRMYFDSREDAEAFADTLEDAEVFSAEDHHESTDSVVDDARTFRNDGAIIHDVMDDGGGPGYYGDPAKVVVAFKPNQLKSADWNTGEFGSGDDLRYSARPVDFDDPADRIEVSTTVPTKKKGGRLVIDAVDDKWIIDADDIRSSKKHRAAAVAAIKTYNAVDMAGKSDAIKALHDTAVDNLIWLHNLMPADLRNRAKLWYDGANRVSQGLADRHGYDIRQVAGVMAVLSPQKDWFMNATLGERVIRIMRDHGGEAWSPAMTAWVNSYANAAKTVDERGKRSSLLETALRLEGQTLDSMGDADAARFVRVFDETYFPRTYRVLTPEGGFGDYVTNAPEEVDADADEAPAGSVAWGTYPSIEKAVAILRDNNPRSQLRTISGALGREHKVRNFYNNIVAPGSADGHVTIDTHAVAAALVKSLSGEAIEVMHNFGRAPRGTPSPGANVDSGASGVYGIYADANRDAAARLGILPRELQSITWEAARAIFTPGFKSTRSAEVEAIYDRYASGEISREQARQEAYELAGGLKALPWEDTPIGRMVEEGGTSFDGDIAADPADREARTLEPFDARDSITVSLSSATGTIPGIDALHDRANKGDAQAARLLQDVAFDALKHLLSGTSARIKRENATGLYGGEVEPSLGVTLTFGDSDRAQVLAALARFADNFNQQQIHVRRETNDAPGMVYDDGSYATPVYRWQLKQALDRKAIQRVIDRSGLYGLTFGDDFVEAYFVGDVTDESARQTFARAAAEADRVLGSRAEGSRRSVARLWPYGDSFAGEPTIGYERIRGDVSTQPVAALPTARRVAEYLNSVDGKPGRVKAFDQAAEITEEQRALQQGIARAYEALPDNDLKNPRVRRAYQALAREVLRQFNALPVRVEVFQGQGEPYANSDAMRRDLADNNHLYIFGTTDDTFGPPGVSFAGHPLLGDSGLVDQNGHALKFNDLLRAVHDYYAHAMSPTQFGPKGEEAAWKNHMAMTRDPWARWALTTETRGQNSWVNFRDDLDPSTPIKDRPFARQKAALIPAEYMLTGNRAVDAPVRRFIDSLPTQQRIGSKPVQYSARDRGPVEYRTVNNEVTDEQFDARGAGALAQGQAAGNRGAEQGERAGPDRGQPARAPGGASGGVGESDRAPRYGRARPGAVSAIGYHFSRQPREHLNGAYYGTGLKGLEAERLAGRENDDIRPRVYFYIDAGNGIRPEAGVGGSAHHVQLDNLYDAGTDPLDIKRRARAIPGNFFNNFEREVVAAGFDGYAVLDPADPQHFAVLIGRRHQSVPVAKTQPPAAREGAPRTMPAEPRPARTERRGDMLTRKPANDELMELVVNAKAIQAAAPSFRMQWGSAMVNEAEAAAADAALEEAGAKFRFGEAPRYSKRDDVSALGFYSELARKVEGASMKQAPAGAWKAFIKALTGKGVKQDEITWSGVEDWLDAQKGKVPRQDVVDYLRGNGVQVEETVLPDAGGAKYGDYSLSGGENYREVLLTLPEKNSAQKQDGSTPYQSSHWDQKNVLAHLRVSDRVDADGKKVLLVDEVQSDWGQDGKRQGFAVPGARERTEAVRKAYRDAIRADAPEAELDRLSDAVRQAEADERGVPAAPFIGKTDGWLNLALKRAIGMAVDGGYDAVAFVTGQQSAERYDLSKHLDQLILDGRPDGGLVVGRKAGRQELTKAFHSRSELDDIVGKEIAERLVQADKDKDGRRSLSGLDLKVGGEGMIAFYDKIVPNAVRALLRKLGGGQMRSVDIPVDGLTQPGFDITDKMRESVSNGQPLFSKRNPQIDTPEFKAWFGDSKVVDANGEPLVVYHGSPDMRFVQQDGVFRSAKNRFGVSDDTSGAFWFAASRNTAKTYADDTRAFDYQNAEAGIVSAYLSLQNPLIVDGKGQHWRIAQAVGKTSDVIEKAKSEGRDGVIIRNVRDDYSSLERRSRNDATDTYMAFRSEQIKSATDNVGTFDPENPDIRYSRRVTTGDHGRAYTPEQRAMFENTGRTVTRATIVERVKEFRRGIGKKLAQGIVDQFRPIRDLDGHAYALARLSKGASGAFEALLNFGKLKIVDGVYDADMSGGFQEKVGMPLGAELDDFVWWVAANRAERLAGQGRENLFTPADIAAGKSLATGQMAHDYTLQNGQVTRDRALAYADSLQKLDAFNKNVLDIAEESGLIDGTTRPYWDDEFYVPFYRVSDDDGGFIGEKIKGGLARQRAFKELKGGSEKLHSDLVQNMLQNWAHLIDASAKNRAAKEAMEAALNVGIAIEASQDMVRQLQRQAGGGSGTAWFMDGGVQRHFLIEDPYVLEAINSLSYAGLKGPMMTALSRAKHWLTAGVTASPGFKVRNLIRDSLQAIATADMNYNPLTNVKHGIEITRKDNQTYVSALASGGLIRFGTGEASQAERMRKLAKRSVPPGTVLDTKGKVEAFYNKYLRPGVEAYQELGSRGEEITRAALYKQLVDKGVSPSEAALQARDLMDFSMQGTWGTIRFLTQVVPFLNARLQGLYKLGRAAKEDPRRFSIVLGATSLASIALLAAYSDDEDWKQREDWDRDGFWWFKFGGVAFRIPKPFEIGALASVAERGVELFTNDEFTAQRFMDRMKHLASDNLSMNPIPQAIKPILDVYANKDSFTGRPIESMGMERLQAEYRYNSYTSALARGASTAMNTVSRGVLGMETLSPVQIDHLTRGYFGWLGTFWVAVGDQALRPMLREPDRPSLDYLKVVTQGLALQLPAPQSKYVSAIYEQSQELDRVYATYRRMVREGKGQDAARFSAENADLLRRQKLVAQVKKTISKSNQRVRDIERDERMDSAEKRRRILREKALQSAAAQRVY